MAEDEKKIAPDAEEGGKKSKKKLFIIIGAVVLLIGIGAGAYFMFFAGKDKSTEDGHIDSPASEEQHGEEKKEDKKEIKPEGKEDEKGNKEEGKEEVNKEGEAVKVDFGATYSLKPFHLNLGNPLENRYIQIDIALEYKGGANQKTEIDVRMAQIRDSVVNVISRKTREFILSPDGKDQLRLEILNQVNQFMDRKIESVLITDVLIE